MNIVLIGMMGAGKTTIGEKLSKATGMQLVDTDQKIVEKHGKISDIFEKYGEERFRDIETETVAEISKMDNRIVSTGGGCVLRKINSQFFQKTGKIVFLRAKEETIYNRVGHTGDVRPLLKENAREKISLLLKERTPIYESCSDFIIDTDNLSLDEVVNVIIEKFCLKRI